MMLLATIFLAGFTSGSTISELNNIQKMADTVMAAPITDALTSFISNSPTTFISEETRQLARLHILDTLASIVACRDLEPSTLARNYALSLSGGWGQTNTSATILGTHERASIVDAVFASAMAGHGAEINDFIPSAYVQPGPAIVSVAFAIAESRRLSGEEVLRAVVTGYELAGRIPKAIGNSNLQKAGVANHGIGPTFGSAAAAASLLKLPREKIDFMLAYCAQEASGSWQWLLDVEHIEKSFVFAGMGARAGLHATLMVQAGFRGVRNSLDNPKAWFRAARFTGGDANTAYLTSEFGTRSELTHTGFKRYPVGGPTQPAVHGLLQLLPNITVSKVTKASIAMPGGSDAFRDASMPALNLRYLFAIILLDQKLDFVSAQSLERMHADKAVLELMKKVDVIHDAAQEAPKGQPRTESARVSVEESDGKKHEIYVPYVKGYPSHPMSKGDVENKALELMSPHLGLDRAKSIVGKIAKLEQISNIEEIVGLMAR
jgi:2-methylcitrate dehydratase PrpD